MNISNKLTIFRILLVPIFVLFLVMNRFLLAGVIFLIASSTDYLDGKLARLNNEITNFGKFFDPIADKLLAISAYVYFVKLNLVSIVPVVVMCARELLITAVRLLTHRKNGEVIAASFLGKLKTVFQIFSILLFILFLYLSVNLNLSGVFIQSLLICSKFFVWLSAAFSVISFVPYFIALKKCKIM